MSSFKFQCSSLLLSKLIRVQSKLDNQVYKEMIGQVLWLQLYHQTINYWSRKTAKNPTYNAFYASKLQDYVEEGLLFQNISKSKNYPCWPWSPISSHNTKLAGPCDFLLVLWCRVTYRVCFTFIWYRRFCTLYEREHNFNLSNIWRLSCSLIILELLKYRFYSNVLMLFHPSYMYSADGIKNRRTKILWFYKMHLCMHKI